MQEERFLTPMFEFLQEFESINLVKTLKYSKIIDISKEPKGKIVPLGSFT